MIPSNQRASASDAQAGISGHRSEIHLTCTLSAQGIRILIVRTKPDIICCTPAQNLISLLSTDSTGDAGALSAHVARLFAWIRPINALEELSLSDLGNGLFQRALQ
jgi:hypothetical protein